MRSARLPWILAFGPVLVVAACHKAAISPPAAMVGAWSGEAEVSINWCKQSVLKVAITILPDGRVEGKVGDATLKNASLFPNPGKTRRGALTLSTPYVVEGDLEGALVTAEGIVREQICMPIDLKGAEIMGAIVTMGGKDERLFSAGLKPLTKSAGR